MIRSIVTVDRDWGMGFEGNLIQLLPGEEKFIRNVVKENVVILGRRAYELFFDEKRSLPAAVVIVISKKADSDDKKTIFVSDEKKALDEAKKYNRDIFVLGGKQTFESLLPYCQEVYLTRLEAKYYSDVNFPNLDKKPEWVLTLSSEEQPHMEVVYTTKKYVRRADYIE